ncbi:subtilisin-like protein [Thozetella sp. PMI_491]|nr:subtilisin-like protein [Thozetella sp. PMI_491]
MRLQVLAWAALSHHVFASPTFHRPVPKSHVIHEQHDKIHLEGWAKREYADPSALLPMRIGLKQSNLQKGHDLLVDMYWIQFQATVEEANTILFADYHIYEHLDSGVLNVATSKYHVPRTLRDNIDYITPGIKLVSEGYSDRAMLADQYGIPEGSLAAPGNELGIFQSLSQHYNQKDLDSMWEAYAPYVPNGTHPQLRAINGAYGPVEDSSMAGEEADLDFQVAIPLIWPQGTVLWQTDDEWYERDQGRSDTKYNGFFNTFFDAIDGSYCSLDAYGYTGNCKEVICQDPVYPNLREGGYKGGLMCGEFKPTNVIAISYSGVEHVLPPGYMKRQCLEVMKLGLQGVTVVESSGDHGVGGRRSDPKSGCQGPNRDVFAPRTMSNCPYVLSVGATTLINSTAGEEQTEEDEQAFTEVAPTYFASGGGFSNVFSTPSWQKEHVSKYIERANMSSVGYVGGGTNYSNVGVEKGKLFNKAGRGYPDVSAIGDNYRVYVKGFSNRLGGTSVAVPIWASILTLINEERLAENLSTVGFVHQVLYDNPGVFTDITVGQNPGCGSNGFPAKKGWDPVTGLGTPIYPELLDLFMSLP